MRRSKSVLIVGGSGFVGSHLASKLREGYKVYSTFYENSFQIPGVTYLPFNFNNRDFSRRVILTAQPDVVIYAAGSNEVEWTERHPREADRNHTGGSALVATIAEIFKPKFIYLSNCYVFDGRKGNYSEDDVVFPPTVLGKCKLGGENFLKGKSMNYLIIRSSPLYGRGNGVHFSFIDKLRYKLDRGIRVEMPTNEIHSFASVEGLAEAVIRLIESNARNQIFHYGGLTKMNYYRFAMEFAKKFGYEQKYISPLEGNLSKTLGEEITTFDYSLNSSSISKTLKIKPLLMEEGFELLQKHLVPPT